MGLRFVCIPAFLMATVCAIAASAQSAASDTCGIIYDDTGASSAARSIAVSNSSIGSEGAYVYQPGFDLGRASGSLKRFRVTADASGAIGIADAADWDAAEILTGTSDRDGVPIEGARRIYTATLRADHSLATVEFKWESLARDQQRQLDISPVSGRRDGYGDRRVAYLRGARMLEQGYAGGIFRARDSVLGDIVNSNPVFVGAPSLDMRGRNYANFHDRYRDRRQSVYVGANDGMLHAFDANDGTELFAYVPSALIPKLNVLTSPDYKHRPFVDGGLEATEAMLGGQWRTVLAASMGSGVHGVFALDITNPADFVHGLGALWEFTDADDADMAEPPSTPTIGRFKISDVNGVARYRNFAVVGSGVRSGGAAGRSNADTRGVLFLLALDKPVTERWHAGVNYYKFKTPATGSIRSDRLSAPALATDRDGAVRYAFAGDRQGNLWRFDFSESAPWTHAIDASSGPLFIAKDSHGVRQPISVQPKVVFAPGGGYVVLFGTGHLAESKDPATGNFRPQSFYAIFDTARGHRVSGRDQLVARVASHGGTGGVMENERLDFTYGTRADDRRGWYLDFANAVKSGERNVTDPVVAYGRVFFNTLTSNGDLCATSGGRTYVLDALTGLRPKGDSIAATAGGGALGPPTLVSTGHADIAGRNAAGSWTATRKYSVFSSGTSGAKSGAAPVAGVGGGVSRPAGRFSWREIADWQDLRHASKSK